MNLEDQYEVIDLEKLDTSKPYYIHVLGAGYDLDKRLQATSQLDLKTLGRLTEGIRVFRKLPNALLVTSGNSAVGLESQASVAKTSGYGTRRSGRQNSNAGNTHYHPGGSTGL